MSAAYIYISRINWFANFQEVTMPENRNLAEAISVRDAAPEVSSAWQTWAARRPLLIGEFVLRYSLVFFLIFFGALKWTAEEAKGIQPWMEHSPLLFLLGRAFGI